MLEYRTTRININTTTIWPLGYGSSMASYVNSGLIKGVLLRALPDDLCGAPDQLGTDMPGDLIDRIPDDAPALLMCFADKDAVRRHIGTLESLLKHWDDD